MFIRHAMAVGIFTVMAAFAPQSVLAAGDDFSAKAEKFIVTLADDAITKLTDKSITVEEQERRFSGIIHDYIAFKSIARWVLGGRYWRAASEDQRERYLSLFEQLMISTYAHRFQKYSGETLEIAGVRNIDAAQVLVQTTLQRPNADKPLRVDWRVRGTEDKLKIIDIMVEGLSMAQTQRSEFSSVLRDNGGDIDALLTTLEERLESARAERMASTEEATKKP